MEETKIRKKVDNRKTNLRSAVYVLLKNRFLRVSMNDFLARIMFSCSFTRALLIEENEPITSLSTIGIENEVF